jgi:hypothetical protein
MSEITGKMAIVIMIVAFMIGGYMGNCHKENVKQVNQLKGDNNNADK